MKRKTAHEIETELRRERNITGGGWYVTTNKERQEAYSRDFAYRDVWTVEVGYKNEEPSISLPEELFDLCTEQDLRITLNLSGWSEKWSEYPDCKTRFILDDGEFEKIEYTEEEQERIKLEKAIINNFDVERQVAKKLTEHFDSLDEILEATREELTEISGIGDVRATKIIHRYSGKAKERLEDRKSGVLVIPDREGILRLPQEFEEGEYVPDYSKAPGYPDKQEED